MHMLIWRRSLLPRGAFEEEHTGLEVAWRPDMDVFEHPDEFLVSLSLPGVPQEEVDIGLAGATMVVSGERRLPMREGAVAHLIESSAGRFERRIRLPANAELTRVRTEMVYGQLLVHVPKRASRTVPVSAQASD